jgi:hypothetical protein
MLIYFYMLLSCLCVNLLYLLEKLIFLPFQACMCVLWLSIGVLVLKRPSTEF